MVADAAARRDRARTGASREREDGLVCTVTTLWDTLANVRPFVSRNLAAGADHMFVFLDAAAPDVREYLEGLDTVTVVRTGKGYWRGNRWASLNSRQIANANLVSHLLSPFDRVRWLFHIDGDESLDIDRDELLTAEVEECPAVRLSTLESVSRAEWDGPVDRFKRTPTPDELTRLARRGVIAEPDLDSYFHGYSKGKVGVRPTLDLRLGIHDVWHRTGGAVPARPSPGWHVLHYDCWSYEEFLRKWASSMSHRRARFNGSRERLRVAANAILDDPSCHEEERDRMLRELYGTTIADDVDALDELDLLVTPRPELHRYHPRGLGADRDAVDRLLRHLVSADKHYFLTAKEQWHPRALFEELRRSGSLDDALDGLVAAALADPPHTSA